MIIRKFKSPVYSEEAIVDNEISNDISVPRGDWLYEKGEIICCAILYKDDIIVILREHGDDLQHYKAYLERYLDKHETMYAFNKNMEYGNFRGFLNKDYNILEIKAWKGKGWNKQKFFNKLIEIKKVKKDQVIEDPLEDDSGLIIERYKNKIYEDVINHNIADVIKQAHILQNNKFLLEIYEEHINSEGWIEGGLD